MLFLVAIRAIGTMLLMVSSGAFLRKKGYLSESTKNVLATLSARLLIPCLLFSRVVYCGDPSCDHSIHNLRDGWVFLILPIWYIGIGLCIGTLLATALGIPEQNKTSFLLAVTFGSASTLPVILLELVAADDETLVKSGNPLLYLSVYLTVYPLLQWTLGSIMLYRDDEGDLRSDSAFQDQFDSQKSIQLGSMERESITRASFLAPEDADDHMDSRAVHVRASIMLIRKETSVVQRCVHMARYTCHHLTQPVVIAAACGLLVSAVPSLRLLFVKGDGNMSTGLGWAFAGILRIGESAVPINLILMGTTIVEFPSLREVFTKDTAGTILGRMLLMPVAGIATIALLRRPFFLNLNEDEATIFLFTAAVLACVPTSSQCISMIEVNGLSSKELSASICGQYILAPVVMTGFVTCALYLSEGRGNL